MFWFVSYFHCNFTKFRIEVTFYPFFVDNKANEMIVYFKVLL